MPIITKICGLSTKEAVDTALQYGAQYLGFIFYPPSPRNITPEHAKAISAHVPNTVKKVAVTVNMPDDGLKALLEEFSPDYLQLHGKETPERVRQIKATYGLPVIKALPVENKGDLESASLYTGAADMLLFDAKPPKEAKLPGGNGVAFDWSILQGVDFSLPWFLSGGLACQNLNEAVKISGAERVDVSSGVESSPGVKDLALIAEFLTLSKLL